MPFPWEVSPFDPLNGAGSPLMYPGLEPPQPPQISGIQPPVMPGPAPTFIGDLGPVQPTLQVQAPPEASPIDVAPMDTTPQNVPGVTYPSAASPLDQPPGIPDEAANPLDQPPGLGTVDSGSSPFGGSWMNPFEPQVGGVPGPPMDIRSTAQKVQGGGGPATQPQNPTQKLLSGLAGIAAPQVPAAQRVATPAAPQGFRSPGRGNAVELMAALGIRGRQPPPYDLPSTFGRALRG